MENISADTELMKHYVAAQGIAETARLIALRDEHHNLMILALGHLWRDEKTQLCRFYLLKKGTSGLYEEFDLGAHLALPSDYKAAAMQAVQDPTTSQVYLALAIEKSSTEGQLFLLEPMSPQDLVLPFSNRTIPLTSSMGPSEKTQIVDIFMGPPTKGIYPTLLLTYKPLNQLGTVDVMAVVVDRIAGSTWTLRVEKQLLPSNATKILALQPLTIEWMSDDNPEKAVNTAAIAFLYDEGPGTYLNIKALNKRRSVFVLECPKDSTTMATIPQQNGFADLLVGGADLHYFPHSSLTKRRAAGLSLSKHSTTPFDCTNGLFVAHSPLDQSISIWGESARRGISYLIPDSLTNNTKSPVSLIPDGKGGNFTAFKAAEGQLEQYVYHSGEKEVSVLEMNAVSGYWNSVPLLIRNMDHASEFQAHVTHVVVMDGKKMPLPNHQLRLHSDSRTSTLVNGVASEVGPGVQGTEVKTDSRGCLSITTPCDSLFSEVFTLTDVKTSKTCTVDPNVKAKEALRRVSDPDGLRKDPMLLKHIGNREDDIKEVSTAIKCMMSVIDGNVTPPSATYVGSVPHDHPIVFNIIDSITELGRQALHWFHEKFEAVKNWLVRKIKDGYEFILHVGEAAYRWIVRTASEAWNGIKLLVNKILKFGKEVIEWIGYIFEWGDIVKTHNSVAHLARSALKCAPDYIETLKKKSDVFLALLKTNIGNWGHEPVPGDLQLSALDKPPPGQNNSTALTSSKVNWAVNLFHHGGAQGLSIVGDSRSVGDGGDAKLQHFFDTFLAKAAKDGEAIMLHLGEALVKLFTAGSWPQVAAILRTLSAATMMSIVDIIQTLIHGFLDVLETVIREFAALIDHEIRIPVISALYKSWTGSTLTVLDGLALLVAFPTTILHKMIYKKAPVDATQVDYKTMIAGQQFNDSAYSLNCLMGVTHMFSQVFMQIVDTVSTVISVSYVDMDGSSSGRISERHGHKGTPSELVSIGPAGGKGLPSKLWDEYGRPVKNVFSVIGVVFSVPFVKASHMDLRWASWGLGVGKASLTILLRYIEAAMKEKIFAVLECLLGTASFGTILAVKVFEYKENTTAESNMWTTLDVNIAVLSEAGLIVGDIGHFLPPASPSRATAEGISLGLDIASYIVIGSQLWGKAAKKHYYGIINI
ncbi:hypothetical protein CCM_09500 [Cordyceps militaris CM01]|uniref:Uncharacterized protein n=1 Tax=Cordyceps militaris (strain CM01) TaxID=983644 RepID=G3JUS7_CORMM|nr:uncharacterized protein CCM_09500 [Cordyceps militaris CM01]EGX87877.1 hypothetical protein CCM_09500 [Cordyceps militaris CM01]